MSCDSVTCDSVTCDSEIREFIRLYDRYGILVSDGYNDAFCLGDSKDAVAESRKEWVSYLTKYGNYEKTFGNLFNKVFEGNYWVSCTMFMMLDEFLQRWGEEIANSCWKTDFMIILRRVIAYLEGLPTYCGCSDPVKCCKEDKTFEIYLDQGPGEIIEIREPRFNISPNLTIIYHDVVQPIKYVWKSTPEITAEDFQTKFQTGATAWRHDLTHVGSNLKKHLEILGSA